MATRPGGKKSVSASLDFNVQMMGIAGALAQFAGLTKQAGSFNRGIMDFGKNSKVSSSQILSDLQGQSGILRKVEAQKALLGKAQYAEMKGLRERLSIDGQGTSAEKEKLKRLEGQLDLSARQLDEQEGMTKATQEFGLALSIVDKVGNAAFGGLRDAMRGVDGAAAEVDEGLGILQDTFSSALNLGQALWDLGAPDPVEAKDDVGEAIDGLQLNEINVAILRFDEAIGPEGDGLRLDEVNVAILRFDEAVGPEVSKVEGVKKEIAKGSKEGKSNPLADSNTKELEKGAARATESIKSVTGESSKANKAIKGMDKSLKGAGKGATEAGQGLKKAGTSSNFLTSAKIRLTNVMGKFGKFATKVGNTVRVVGQIIGTLGAAAPFVGAAILILGTALLALAVAARYLAKGIKLAVKNMEEYRTVNYRALGSIQELTMATYDISTATGLSNKQSVEAIKAMSDVGITANELTRAYGNNGSALRDLASMQGKFRRMTGASAASIAGLQKQLIAGGMSMKAMQRTFDKTSGAMRRVGISGQDASTLMSGMSSSLIEMNGIFKGKELDNYVNTMTDLAGAAKRAGVSMAVVKQIDDDLRGLKGGASTLIALSGNFGDLVKNGIGSKDTMNNMLKGYKNLERQFSTMPKGLQEAQYAQMGITGAMRATLQAERDRRNDMMKTFMKQGMSASAAKKATLAQIDLDKEQDALRKKASDDYQTSISTLTQQMQQMFAPLQAKAAKAMMPLIQGFTAFISRVGPIFTEVIGSAMDLIISYGKYLGMIFMWVVPIIEVVGSILGWVTSILFKMLRNAVKYATILALPFYALYVALKTLAKPIIFLGQLIYNVFGGALDAVGWVYDKISALGMFLIDVLAPVLGVIAGIFIAAFFPALAPILAIAGAVYVVYNVLKYLWNLVAGPLMSAFSSVWGAIKEAFQPLVVLFSSIYGYFAGLIEGVYNFAMSVWDMVGGVKGALTYLAIAFFPVTLAIGAIYFAFKAVWWLFKTGISVIASYWTFLWGIIKGGIDFILTPFKALGDAILWLLTPFKMIKDFIFGSSFLHIGEGIGLIMPFFDLLSGAISFLLTPLKMIGAAFGWLFDLGASIFGGLVDIVTSPFDAIGSAVGAIGNVVAAPFKAVGNAISGAWDWLTGGGEEEKVVGSIQDQEKAMAEAYALLENPIGSAISTVGDAIGDAWDWLTGGGEEKKATKSIKDQEKAMAEAYALLDDPIGSVIGNVGDAVGDAWDWLTGGGEEEKATKSIQDQEEAMTAAYALMESPLSSAISSVSDALSSAWDWVTGVEEEKAASADSAPIYTSKFDDDSKRSGAERSGELVMLQQETVALLAKILEKADPNNERAADAIEKIADKATEAEQPDVFRSRKGFGENVTNWWINK